MRRSYMFIALVFLGNSLNSGLAQQRLEISKGRMCAWNDEAIVPEDLYSFPADEATKDAVAKIMKYTGLDVNFDLVAANVPNAIATVDGSKRLILFNQLFMKDIGKQANSDWASISILAHEIGHHLQQHTLASGSVPRDQQELAADRFSGDVLFKMGASLDDARAAMLSRPDTKSAYYPKRSVRLIAIGNGWIAAQELASSHQVPGKTAIQRESEAAAERIREAERVRKEEEKAEQDRKAGEKEERERRAEERRQKEEERKQRELESSRGCYDGFGRRWCSLARNFPVGALCYCNYLPGTGIAGSP